MNCAANELFLQSERGDGVFPLLTRSDDIEVYQMKIDQQSQFVARPFTSTNRKTKWPPIIA